MDTFNVVRWKLDEMSPIWVILTTKWTGLMLKKREINKGMEVKINYRIPSSSSNYCSGKWGLGIHNCFIISTFFFSPRKLMGIVFFLINKLAAAI